MTQIPPDCIRPRTAERSISADEQGYPNVYVVEDSLSALRACVRVQWNKSEFFS